MTTAEWLVFALGVGAIAVYAAWWYRSREEPVAGLAWAAILRAIALSFILLLLLNPGLPARGTRATEGVALVDASLSMARLTGADRTPIWKIVRDSAAHSDAVWMFGGATYQAVPPDSLPEEPFLSESRLVPAIRSLAAAGVRQAVLLTDGRLSDVAEAAEEARRRGVALSVRVITSPLPEYGIAELSATRWAQPGDSIAVRLEIVAAAEAESARVVILDDQDRVRAEKATSLPGTERFATERLIFPAPRAAGYHRFRARLTAESPDAESRDNVRVFYVRIAERPVGPVLISIRPDWEPSFLLPILDRVSDELTTAYFWIGDTLLEVEGYGPVTRASVLRRSREAPLLVLHGYSSGAPTWVGELVRDARNLMVLPVGPGRFELDGWDVLVAASQPGEWYVSDELPASALAVDLVGLVQEGLPPLVRTRSIQGADAWAPVMIRRSRRGEPAPAIVLGRSGARRWAVAAAEGYWRWSIRAGAGRQLYRSLWAGVAGWLIGARGPNLGGIDPRRRVVPRGEPLEWLVPSGVDSLTVELSTPDGGRIWRSAAPSGDSLAVTLPPGRYRYQASLHREGAVAASSEGPAEVEEFTRELLPKSAARLEALTEIGIQDSTLDRAGSKRPLATLGWPYLVLIALFCGEWIVRRTIGLR